MIITNERRPDMKTKTNVKAGSYRVRGTMGGFGIKENQHENEDKR